MLASNFRPFLAPLLAILLVSAAATARERLALDTGWAFHLGDASGAETPGFDASAWTAVEVPHDWSIGLPRGEKEPTGGNGGFFQTGIGWYRRSFEAPASWRGQRIELEFEGVYQNAEVWLNGVSLGRHPYGYTPFALELSSHLRYGERNVLAVRVDNSAQPNCRWYSGSGLYRPVWLQIAAPVHVVPEELFLATTALSESQASVRAELAVRNDGDSERSVQVELQLLDPEGRLAARVREKVSLAAGQSWRNTRMLTVENPKAWSPETPALYRAKVTVGTFFRQLDAYETSFGLRTVKVSAERGFELNGKPVKLNGGSIHHDSGPLGAMTLPRAEERKVELLKAAGFNSVRTAHNPPSTAFLEACDRLGLLVMDECFDGWAKAKNPHDYSVWFAEWWRRDLESWVKRDRNHPSVVIWSVGNEMYERGGAEGRRLAGELVAAVRALDNTRPLGAGVNGFGKPEDWAKLDALFSHFDIAGYNYELHRHTADHERVPGRVILATESYQNEVFANWRAVHAQPWIIGDLVWSSLDYLGESSIGRVFPPDKPVVKHWEGNQWPWQGAYCGDLDLVGWRKPVSHYRNIVWDRGERLYIAVETPSPDGRPWNVSPWAMPPSLPSWTWPGHEDKPLSVEVYSRHEAVKLLLNGVALGEKPTTEAEAFLAKFTVPYAAGELVALGLDGGRETERVVLRTASAPAAFRLSVDRPKLRADGQDLAYVVIEAVDAKGQANPQASLSASVEVTGAGTLAALGTGDPESVESFLATKRTLFQGRAVAIVRASRTPGSIQVRVSAPGLETVTAVLRTESP